MTAAAYDITIEQGEDWVPIWKLKFPDGTPFDLTGYSADMNIRSDYYAVNPMFDISTSNGMIVLGGSSGTISFAFGRNQTMALFPVNTPAPNPVNRAVGKRPVTQVGVYDLRLTSPSGRNWPIAGGRVFVVPNVTR